LTQDNRNNKQKTKSSKSLTSPSEDNPKFLNRINHRSNSLQHFSKLSNKGSLKEIKDAPNHLSHLKKTKSDNQDFKNFFGSSTSSTLNQPSSSPKNKKSIFSSNNYSTPILPQTKLLNTGSNPHNVFATSKQNFGFANSTANITSLSPVTATPNFLKKSNSSTTNGYYHHPGHSHDYLSGKYTIYNF